jgi:hypothetical protein
MVATDSVTIWNEKQRLESRRFESLILNDCKDTEISNLLEEHFSHFVIHLTLVGFIADNNDME